MQYFLLVVFLLLFVWVLMKFDHAHYQHMVVLENSLRRGTLRNWGRVVDVLLPLAFFIMFFRVFLQPIRFSVTAIDSTFIVGIFERVWDESIFKWLALLGCVLSLSLICISFVWPRFRAYMMSKLNLDPQRYAHCFAFWGLLFLLLGAMFIWSFLSIPDFMGYLDKIPPHEFAQELIVSLLLNSVLALLVVGWGTHRSWCEVWERLGLNRRPTWKEFLLIPLLVVAFFFVLGQVASFVISIGNQWGVSLIQQTDPVVPPLAWIIVPLMGICAGVGEELLFRGALQPRVGIFISSIAFTLIHVLNGYDWFGLLGVFTTSLLFGWIARRYSLWLSMWAHAFFNVFLSILIFFSKRAG
ncbi:CPBP family intramembrane glutamic endopeptidase [Pasteuria penetrans]|uniref:CPBP family intramembrane glutamic endopeptidase n=1 Tax=Pasteuria penetrans TaxID=86005 RepID=UPI000F9F7673|nr:CPBP family intramembrane glutamic endopeptidase [Pasteuria penetrans]